MEGGERDNRFRPRFSRPAAADRERRAPPAPAAEVAGAAAAGFRRECPRRAAARRRRRRRRHLLRRKLARTARLRRDGWWKPTATRCGSWPGARRCSSFHQRRGCRAKWAEEKRSAISKRKEVGRGDAMSAKPLRAAKDCYRSLDTVQK